MNKNFYFFLLLSISLIGFSQEETKTNAPKLLEEAAKLKAVEIDTTDFWKIGGVVSLNGQQVALSNWAAGGNNSISVAGLVNVYAKYRKHKTTWDNNLELGYGVIISLINNSISQHGIII